MFGKSNSQKRIPNAVFNVDIKNQFKAPTPKSICRIDSNQQILSFNIDQESNRKSDQQSYAQIPINPY